MIVRVVNQNCFKVLDLLQCKLYDCVLWLTKFLRIKWPRSKLYERHILSFSKSNWKKDNLYVHSQNTVQLGNKSLRSLGARIRNSSPENEFHEMSYTSPKMLWKSGQLLHLNAIHVVIYKLNVTNYIQVKGNFNSVKILI